MKLTPVTPGRRFYDLFRTQGKLVSETLTELSKSLLEGKSRHARLRDLEHECDRLMRAAIGDLFSHVNDASELVKWKDVYDLLEATMDSCEHAANVMETIAIKNA